MAKFIRIKNHLINIEKVVRFDLDYSVIWVYTDDGFDPFEINFNSEREAELVFEDIPHLIDNNHIPRWVYENNEPRYFNEDYGYDELPF